MVDSSVNCLAPFFEDHDPRNGGQLYYNTYEMSVSSSAEATAVFNAVKGFIQDKYSLNFNPTIIIKATWNEIPHYSFQTGQVSERMFRIFEGLRGKCYKLPT